MGLFGSDFLIRLAVVQLKSKSKGKLRYNNCYNLEILVVQMRKLLANRFSRFSSKNIKIFTHKNLAVFSEICWDQFGLRLEIGDF
jgi:hypothetical protein